MNRFKLKPESVMVESFHTVAGPGDTMNDPQHCICFAPPCICTAGPDCSPSSAATCEPTAPDSVGTCCRYVC